MLHKTLRKKAARLDPGRKRMLQSRHAVGHKGLLVKATIKCIPGLVPVPLSRVKAQLSAIVDQVRTQDRAVEIQKHAKGVAVLVEIEHYRRLLRLEDVKLSERIDSALKGKTVPLREALQDLELG